jgi:hypothetical protein
MYQYFMPAVQCRQILDFAIAGVSISRSGNGTPGSR